LSIGVSGSLPFRAPNGGDNDLGVTEEKKWGCGKGFENFPTDPGEKKTAVNRDAAIQRFEYTTEAVWKCLQLFMKESEGIECYSPKTCLREAKHVGLLNDQQTALALEMIDDSNLTSHTYHEEVAEKIYARLPAYAEVLEALLQRMGK